MVVQKFLKDLRRVWVRGSAPFLPTAQRRETDVEIMLLQDRDGRTLRKSIALAPSCQRVHRRVNFVYSDLPFELNFVPDRDTRPVVTAEPASFRLMSAIADSNRTIKGITSVLRVGLGNFGRIGEIHETFHFAILDRPNVHQRKVETFTCRGHCRTVPTDHDYIVTLRDEFISPKRMVLEMNCNPKRKSGSQ